MDFGATPDYGGLDLLETEEFVAQAKSFLFAGAEALEFLVSSTETYRGSPLDAKLRCAAAYYLAGYHARAYVILDRDITNPAELGPLGTDGGTSPEARHRCHPRSKFSHIVRSCLQLLDHGKPP